MAGRRQGQDAGRLQGGVPAVCRKRLERPDQESRARRPGPAAARGHRGRGNVARRQHGVRAVSAADPGCDRGARALRLRRAEGDVPAEDGLGRVDRHDEPDRAAGGLRSRGGAHARACRRPTAAYKLYGQKIFITYGEHDYTDNIIHLVLARTPTAPEGVKGISLFLVPKVPGQRRRQPGCAQRRALRVDRAQARHSREPDRGAGVRRPRRRGRLSGRRGESRPRVHVHHDESRALLGRASKAWASPSAPYQRALAYARDRVQGRAPGLDKTTPTATIIQHPDVRRMLLTMKAQTEAMRAVAYVTGAAIDNARRHPDAERAQAASGVRRSDDSDRQGLEHRTAQEVTYLGVQVHGGMGFIEETGAAQHYRDARITTIYEGTTAIQANDLIGRKTARDGGAVARAVIAEMDRVAARLSAAADEELEAHRRRAGRGGASRSERRSTGSFLPTAGRRAPRTRPRCPICGCGDWLRAAGSWRAARWRRAHVGCEARATPTSIAARSPPRASTPSACCRRLSRSSRAITRGSEAVLALADEQF